MTTFRKQGFGFSAGGDYQKRLEIYRTMSLLYNEGLAMYSKTLFVRSVSGFKRVSTHGRGLDGNDAVLRLRHGLVARSRRIRCHQSVQYGRSGI
jgi:hypothetical protein